MQQIRCECTDESLNSASKNHEFIACTSCLALDLACWEYLRICMAKSKTRWLVFPGNPSRAWPAKVGLEVHEPHFIPIHSPVRNCAVGWCCFHFNVYMYIWGEQGFTASICHSQSLTLHWNCSDLFENCVCICILHIFFKIQDSLWFFHHPWISYDWIL